MKKTTKLNKLNRKTANKRLGLLLVKSGIQAGAAAKPVRRSRKALDKM